MARVNSELSKVLKAARAISATSFHSWQTARRACGRGANQKWSELSRLVHLLRKLRPAVILEIGVDSGGTMALWSQLAAEDAVLIALDLTITSAAKERIRAALRPKQQLFLVESDSHSDCAKSQVLGALAGMSLDFLFIDGDHTYDGVRQDYETYAPYVRAGGLIAFHDIVPDYRSRFGMSTPNDSGGVHLFWNEIRSRLSSSEFIEDKAQNGYGLGLIYTK